MPFMFKLSLRWSRFRTVVVAATLGAAACEFRRALTSVEIDRVELSPSAVTVQPHQTADFIAVALDNQGDTADVAVTWGATAGSITDIGVSGGRHLGQYYNAECGTFLVIATSEPGAKADTARVTVTCPAPPPVATVELTPASASLEVGRTVQLAATPKDANGNPLSGRVVTWATNNTAVATVSASGLVTGVAAGAATITATSEGQTGTAAITVTAVPVASVTLTPTSAAVEQGKTVQLTATPKDANGNALSGRVVTWTSDNTAVATVSATGLVTGVAVGSATITATSEGQTGTAAITVTAVPVASVTVTPASASLEQGKTVQLTATPTDAAGNPLSSRVVTWTSSNAAVATVSSSGLVTGVVPGSVTITVTSEGQRGTAAITVTAAPIPVASVEVIPSSADIQAGQTVQLTATPKDANGNPLSGRTVTWTSNNTAVATVSSSGLVTGNAAGSATITATSEGQSGSAVITVVPAPVASVSVTPPSATVQEGSSVQLTATPKDANGNPLSGRVVTWASSNTAVATVSSSGLVTGVAARTATITATSEGQSGNSTVTVMAAPPPGTGVVLVGAGDIASCSSSGDEATAALLDNIPGTVFTAGDNVYDSGTASQFANCYDPTWGRHKARTRPSPGNHDYNTSGATGYYNYFAANAGPSGRGYYSYDLGDWHVISLNSNISMGAGSAQEQWLRADLTANPKKCVLAYWHHPRFSSGSHGSSTASRPLWEALYDHNADVIVVGHDHNYQRFAPQTPTGVADAARGIRQFVAGMGGRSHYNFGTPIANTEAYNTDTYGVLKLTLYADSYTWEFIPVAGKTYRDSGSGSCH